MKLDFETTYMDTEQMSRWLEKVDSPLQLPSGITDERTNESRPSWEKHHSTALMARELCGSDKPLPGIPTTSRPAPRASAIP